MCRALLHSGGIEQLLLEYHWNPSTTALNDRYDMIMKRYRKNGFLCVYYIIFGSELNPLDLYPGKLSVTKAATAVWI